MRTFITLDPEYLPWAPETPNVKLRRKHNKIVEFMLPLCLMALMMGGIFLYLNRESLTQGSVHDPIAGAATPAVTAMVGERATMSPVDVAAPTMGQIGALTLIRKRDQITLYCKEYRLIADDEIISQGSTITNSKMAINNELVMVHGAVVDVRSHKIISVVCDGKTVTP